jgi:outer membrane protein insertion porin family
MALIFGLLLTIAAPISDASAQNFNFNSFEIDGNQRVEAGTILNYAGIERGRSVSAAELNDAFQRIQNSGLFEEVNLTPRGSTLVISVTEYPTINRISIEGNRRLNDDALLPLISSSPRRVFSPSVAEQDAAALVGAYESQGRLSATVDPKIIRRTDNRVDLVFEITEGRVTEIERLSFVGNRAYSDRRLRRVLETKQANLFRTFIRRDTFVADRIDFDRQVLRDFYLSRGYVDFQILDVTAETSRERNASFITFSVREGQSFDFGEITATSDLPDVDPDEFLAASKIRTGGTFSPLIIDNTITRMERLAIQKGLDFVRVEPRITRNDRQLILDVEFAITRGPRVFVERIDIEGNQTTLDRVVRRQFDTVEGDPFNPREIRASAERVRALGFFSNVDVQTREGSGSDQVIVDVDVDEQPTGSLGFGASYSTDSGVGFVLSFSERNFLGRGQTLKFDLNTTSSTGSTQVTFIEPAFLSRDVRLTLQAFDSNTEQDNSFFDSGEIGLRAALAFPVGESSELEVSLGAAKREIFNVAAGSSPIIFRDEGKRTIGQIGYRYTYDSRTTGLNPDGGVLFTFGQDFVGFGGDGKFIKTTARATGQQRVLNDEVTLRATLEGGALNSLEGNSVVTDRFFLSTRQLRGFEFRGVGPRDFGAANRDVLGGNYYVAARLEADFPLGLPEELGVSGGVFLDMGSVWGLDDTVGLSPVDDGFELRSAIGFSLFWTTPIGPLTFNFSKPLKKVDGDIEQNFDVTITARF